MDTGDFAEQLEKLYRLEQLPGSVSLLPDEKEADEKLSEAISRSAIPGLIGKRVKAYTNKVYCERNKSIIINYNLKSELNSGEILIADKLGNLVKVIELTESGMAIGSIKLIWDGKDNTGNTCPTDVYTLIAKARDIRNLEYDIEIYTEGTIDKINFSEIGISLKVNNLLLAWAQVFDFSVFESGYI